MFPNLTEPGEEKPEPRDVTKFLTEPLDDLPTEYELYDYEYPAMANETDLLDYQNSDNASYGSMSGQLREFAIAPPPMYATDGETGTEF
jgi:hypothetical protein